MIAITVALLVISSFSGELLAQELYRWVDDKGIIHFSDSLHFNTRKISSRGREEVVCDFDGNADACAAKRVGAIKRTSPASAG